MQAFCKTNGKRAIWPLLALCCAYAAVRVWYTLVINMGALGQAAVLGDAQGTIGDAAAATRVVVDTLIAVFALRIGTLVKSRWTAPVAGAMLAAATALLFFAGPLTGSGTFGPVALGVTAGILSGAGSDLLYLAWSEALVLYNDRSLARFILAKTGLDAALSFLAFLPAPVCAVAGLACAVLGACGLAASCSVPAEAAARKQRRWHAVEGRTLPILAAGVTILFFGFSFSQSIVACEAGQLSDATVQVIAGRWVTFGLMALGLHLARDAHFEALYRIASMTAIVGFLALTLGQAWSYSVFMVCVIAAARLAEDTTVLALVTVSRYTLQPPLRVLAWGRVCFRAGAWVAVYAVSGLIALLPATAIAEASSYTCVVLVALLAITGMWLLREQRINAFLWGRGAIDGKPVRPNALAGEAGATVADGTGGAPAPQATLVISPRCRMLAAGHGLTERETEVLSLLLDGRSVPYIQETLHVSANTAKTHIRHIYQKTDVHSRQDLISLAQDTR